MKLQRNTIFLVITALLLGGVALLTQSRSGDRPATVQTNGDASPVYTFDEQAVVRLRIETDGQAVAFERGEDGFWQMTEPTSQPAEEAAIAFLLSRLTTDGLLQTTTIDAANQAEFGLEVPFATIEITLEDGTNHSLVLGDADFSGQNAYALIDPETFPLPEEAGEVSVAVVSQDIVNGSDRPLQEWQASTDAETSEAAPAEAELSPPAPEENADTDSAEADSEDPETEVELPTPDTESSPADAAPDNPEPSQP